MIKRYLEFISESNVDGFESFGKWIESLSDDDYILNIVNRYIDDHNKLYAAPKGQLNTTKMISNEVQNFYKPLEQNTNFDDKLPF